MIRPLIPKSFQQRWADAILAALRVVLALLIPSFGGLAVAQTLNSDPDITLVQGRLENYLAALDDVRAAQRRDWNHVPPELMEIVKARAADFESTLLPRWQKILGDPTLDQESQEAILACLEQRLGAEDYMTFLMRCVDLRERGVIDSATLASLFFGNFAFRGADGVESVKEQFLAANYRSPQVRVFIERATPYLQETELWPGIESLIREILSGKRNRWNWDRLDYHRPVLLNATIWLRWKYCLAVLLIATAVASALLKIRHRRKCSVAISVIM